MDFLNIYGKIELKKCSRTYRMVKLKDLEAYINLIQHGRGGGQILSSFRLSSL